MVTATLQLAENRVLFWSATPLAGISMLLLLLSYFYPLSLLLIVNGVVLALFLGLVCIGLFNYLGRPGPITSGLLYASMSIYFLLGLCWFSLYNVINKLHPGSFAVNGTALEEGAHQSVLLYFSLVSLTTLGYGDIVPPHFRRENVLGIGSHRRSSLYRHHCGATCEFVPEYS